MNVQEKYQLWLDNVTDEELKKEFIKWFGEEKWEEEEILEFLQGIIFDVCREYLNIEPIPVVFEKVPGNIAVFDNKLICIKVNPEYKYDKVKNIKGCLCPRGQFFFLLIVKLA